MSRTPHRVRGLKYKAGEKSAQVQAGRTPHRVRGLKLQTERVVIDII